MPVATFVPDGVQGRRPDSGAALAVCAGCKVRLECAADPDEHDDEVGVWGGLTPAQRRDRRAR
jgi:hypothetical protein